LKKIFESGEFVRFNYVINTGYLAGEIDIITDDYIYDIKTTAFPDFTKDMVIQLVLYYFLLKSHGIEKDKAGIIFSKFNHIEEIKFKKLFKKKGEQKISKYLEDKYLI